MLSVNETVIDSPTKAFTAGRSAKSPACSYACRRDEPGSLPGRLIACLLKHLLHAIPTPCHVTHDAVLASSYDGTATRALIANRE
jgi:hypothetical protein